MASSVHRRCRENVSGNVESKAVRQANTIAVRTALLLLLATVLDIPWAVLWLLLDTPGNSGSQVFGIAVHSHSLALSAWV